MNEATRRKIIRVLDIMEGGSNEDAVVDLIADLLHYSDYKKFDTERVIYWGVEHYKQEVIEDERPTQDQ